MASEFVKQLIHTNKLLVFAKTTCPYCVKVSNLFRDLKVQPNYIWLDQRDDGPTIQSALREITGVSTVPQVFIKEKFIGGCDDTHKLHNKGGLVPLLKDAGLLE
ncbi:glutaredoxin [Tieghemostelium lacteum]|uniref:Glutaredoxin n=1 Tax=Tieghemostelium lacteum TaxID=361077 RepID=A0A151ZBZ8_TIELA|nr:glutaredoxin [Tieghemostelium lacteum]|eukprot:KYQ91473.1 glutaredoxin [Tieghemostelium lacteum]